MLQHAGHHYNQVRGDGIDFAVLELFVSYRKPLYFDEEVDIYVDRWRRDPDHLPGRLPVQVAGETRSTAVTVHGAVDSRGRGVRLPSWLAEAMEALPVTPVLRHVTAEEPTRWPPMLPMPSPGVTRPSRQWGLNLEDKETDDDHRRRRQDSRHQGDDVRSRRARARSDRRGPRTGKVVLFAVPGAFTPTCSDYHLPSYVIRHDELKAKGVDKVACISVNDPFVMDAWGKDQNVGDLVIMLADGNGEFTRAVGLEMDGSGFGLGTRARSVTPWSSRTAW